MLGFIKTLSAKVSVPFLTGGVCGWVFFSLLLSCSQAERLYDTYPVRFVVQNTNTNEVLNAALTGMGEFCTITSDGQRYLFTDASNHTSTINATAINSREKANKG